MNIEEKKKLKQLDRVAIRKLRAYFTGEPDELFENGYIGFHPSIDDNIVNDIISLTDNLDLFLHLNFKETNIDYHYNSESGCYILSSVFCLSNSNWNLIQGDFDFEIKENHFYHSWLEKDGIIFDPAMKVVTLKSMYEEFFIPKYKYKQEELKELFKRTGMFTYYEKDLKDGCINSLAQMVYYDTEEALNSANNILNSLDVFLKQKSK